MVRNLIPLPADHYRVIAPDYPGFGQSAMPDRKDFDYTFAHYADLVDALLQKLEVNRCAIYLMEYGTPVGYRIALKHPDRVRRSSSKTATGIKRKGMARPVYREVH
jgi:pimeloyl-ACP methyl ester carboxylesterase